MFVMPKFGCTIFLVPLDVRSRYKAIGFLVYISYTYNNIDFFKPFVTIKNLLHIKKKGHILYMNFCPCDFNQSWPELF
jgi:hypothetical protein